MILYRVVRSIPPLAADFRSNQARGRLVPPRADSETRRLWDGVSAWDSEALARWTAQAYPATGAFIAALDIPEGSLIRFEPTRGRGHYTLWGEPTALLACVVATGPA